METNNELNQNPEEVKKTDQDENSNPVKDSKKETDKTTAKKSGKSQKDEEKEGEQKPSTDASGEPSKVKAMKDDPEKDSIENTEEQDQVTEESKTADKAIEDISPDVGEQKTSSVKKEDPVKEIPIPSEKELEESKDPPASQPEKEQHIASEDKNKPVEESSSQEVLPELEVEHDEEEDEEHHEEHEEEKVNYDELELEELVSLLEEMVQVDEISALRKKVALLKVSFVKKNKARQEAQLESKADKEDEHETTEITKDDLTQRFDEAFKVYSKKRKEYLAQEEVQKQTNLDTKKLILEELKALIESEESLKKTYDDFKDLQEKWKAVGMVPKSEVNNLWQNYHFYVEKFFDKVKINKELRDLDLKKNLESKIELCEKAEELLLETSVLKSFKQLQQYHRQWKEIGPVPQDKKDELWERFKSTTEKINEGRRDHYNKLREGQESNFVAKTALCEKAEEILQRDINTIKDWQANTDEISGLLKFWKTIGPAPRNQNDEIWERFKTSLDTFFAAKKEYFQTIKDEQLHNYNLKLDLCTQAEAIKTSTDWKQTTRELINLQKDWKQIGPVPRKHSDKIWHRFRAACDEFFNNKSEYFSNIKTHEADNLKAKEEIIKKVESFTFGEDKNENLETLKGFQREWTEIGHVPFKEKDKIQNAFRSAINVQLDKLKISKAEMQTVNFKQRFENLKDKPDANRILRNEKHFLTQKMKKLEEEIQLLENNMGFLAKSKKADLLKAEFTKKIEGARTEVEVLKEKIKFLEREAE